MNYVIKELNYNNVEDYVRVNVLAWKQSYKGIVNDDFLNFINTEEQIQKIIDRVRKNIKKGFILYVDGKPVGMCCIGSSRQDNYKDIGELQAIYLLDEVKSKGYGKILYNKAVDELKKMGYSSMIIGCLKENSSNEFYKHMGGKLVDNSIFNLPNQQLEENIYYFNI